MRCFSLWDWNGWWNSGACLGKEPKTETILHILGLLSFFLYHSLWFSLVISNGKTQAKSQILDYYPLQRTMGNRLTGECCLQVKRGMDCWLAEEITSLFQDISSNRSVKLCLYSADLSVRQRDIFIFIFSWKPPGRLSKFKNWNAVQAVDFLLMFKLGLLARIQFSVMQCCRFLDLVEFTMIFQ